MQSRGRVGGVEGRQDEVTGKRRLHGDPGRVDVSDLADEDDVGVLAKNRSQPVCEGDSRLLICLDLVDRGKDVFDRVFDGHDVAVWLVDLGQRRIQGRGLATSRLAPRTAPSQMGHGSSG